MVVPALHARCLHSRSEAYHYMRWLLDEDLVFPDGCPLPILPEDHEGGFRTWRHGADHRSEFAPEDHLSEVSWDDHLSAPRSPEVWPERRGPDHHFEDARTDLARKFDQVPTQ